MVALNCGMQPALRDALAVADGKRSFSLIHAALKSTLSLDENVVALWSDSIAQAHFLMSAFEMAWEQASDAKERIDELLRQEHQGSLESVAPRIKTFQFGTNSAGASKRREPSRRVRGHSFIISRALTDNYGQGDYY